MGKNFLDYTGLTVFTQKIETFILDKVANLVPKTRTINGKTLSSDITLTAEDIGVSEPDLSGYVPTTRTVNGKPLSSDVTLTAEDIGVSTPDLSGYVPSTRTVNGKPLTSDVTLSASDVNALPTDGTAVSATKLATARTIRTNLSSTSTASFNGTDNVTPGVTGTLGVSNGGTGVTSLSALKEALDIETPDLSAYAPKESPVFTGSISLGRKSGTTVGSYSVAIGTDVSALSTNSVAMGYNATADNVNCISLGSNTTAAGIACFAEGGNTTASWQYSHAEGYGTQSSGKASHSEGYKTEATGDYAHAEGQSTTASGLGSHAEGISTDAAANASHVEGVHTLASGHASHAGGVFTIASSYASQAFGRCNKEMNMTSDGISMAGDVFVVGNGTTNIAEATSRSNAFRIAYNGTIYATSQYMSTGADYAEYFEWLDGNPNAEDRVGHFVTLEGDKIKLAQEGDYILGVISGQPCVIGNADEDWLGRWEHDDFNRFVKEYLTHAEVEVFPPDDVTNAANPDEALQLWLIQNNVETRDGHYFKMETEVVDYPTASWRHKANPSYDPSQPYVERKDRQEWDAVGMVGVLSVIDDGTCVVNGYAKVGQDGVATAAERHSSEETWRVIGRTNNIVKIVFR